jgi:hypothetical protein
MGRSPESSSRHSGIKGNLIKAGIKGGVAAFVASTLFTRDPGNITANSAQVSSENKYHSVFIPGISADESRPNPRKVGCRVFNVQSNGIIQFELMSDSQADALATAQDLASKNDGRVFPPSLTNGRIILVFRGALPSSCP